MASWLTTRNSNLAAFNAFSINYSTLTGSTSNNIITAGRVNYSTITGSSVAATSVATNSLLLASTLTGSSIILSGNVLNSGTINDLTLSRVTTSISVGVNNGYGTGGYNVVYGSQNGNSSFTGNSNVMLGYNTGQSFTSASGNTLVGIATGNSITTGISNTLVGYAIGNAITTGYNNIVVGYSSGISMTTCEGNVIMGKDAGRNITTGNWNVAIGERALSIIGSTGTGNYNVALGHYTFPQLTTGQFNVGVGAFAGTNVTTGTYNTYIGYDCRASGAEVVNEIVIGASATGAGSNTITLGNSSNTKTIFTAGNVGIGTANPSKLLTVGTAVPPVANSAGTTNLVVYGNINCYRNRLIFSDGGAPLNDFNHCIYNNALNIDNEGALDSMKFNVFNGAWFRVGNAALGIVPTTALFINSSGNTTIGAIPAGAAQPGHKLIIEQGISTNNNGLFISNSNYGSMQGLSISMVNAGGGNFYTYAVLQGTTSGVAGTTHLCLQPTSGNVGIGTTSPTQTLHVYGGTGRMMVESISDNLVALVQMKTNNNTSFIFTDQNGHLTLYPNTTSQHILLQPASGNVGIGTATPANTLHVNGTSRLGGNTGIRVFTFSGTFPASATQSTIALPSGATSSNIISMQGFTTSDIGDNIPWDFRADSNWVVTFYLSSLYMVVTNTGPNTHGKAYKGCIITSS